MTDELCDKCGIGLFLPSGRCDHCNCLQCLAHVRELLTPEEKATHAEWERKARPAADFAEKQSKLIDSVRTTPRIEQPAEKDEPPPFTTHTQIADGRYVPAQPFPYPGAFGVWQMIRCWRGKHVPGYESEGWFCAACLKQCRVV